MRVKVKKVAKTQKTKKRPHATIRKPVTHVAMVLDRSSSMMSIRSEAVAAYNEQLATLRKSSKGQDVRVTLCTFSTVADHIASLAVPLNLAEDLALSDYQPNGMTAMYDGVGQVVTALEDISSGAEDAFLLVVISDGAENNSKVWSSERLAKKIQALQKTGQWTIVYLGANQDLTQVQQTLNIHAQNTMSFDASSAGMRKGTRSTNIGTQDYMQNRARGHGAVTAFYVPPDAMNQKGDDDDAA